MFFSKNKKFKKEIKLFKTHLPNLLKHGTLLSSKIERYHTGKKYPKLLWELLQDLF